MSKLPTVRQPRRWGLERLKHVLVPLAAFIVIAAVIAVSVVVFTPCRSCQAGPRVHVTVDFAHPLATDGSMLGFLHGLDETTPETRWIEPLHPALWRGQFYSAPYERAVSFGARYVLVVSDLWGYPGAHWYGREPPWEEPGVWFAFVRNLALANRGRPELGAWPGGNGEPHELELPPACGLDQRAALF
jgi:hypothetical protein